MLPPTNQTVSAGADVSFSTALVGNTSAQIRYQWQSGAGALTDATNASITLSNVQPAAAGDYSVVVTITTNTYVAPATFTANLQVLPPNTPPMLEHIPDYTIDEQTRLKFSALATDSDLPSQTLAFSLSPGAPAGASLSADGRFKWIPSEAQGPGVYNLTVQVTDNGTPNLTAGQTFRVTVNEVNSPPLFLSIRDKYVKAGTLLSFRTAEDFDLPPQNLSFTMNAGSAQGASIDPASGIISWTPGDAQAPGNYPVPVQVSDDGIPPMSASATFTIHVLERNATLVLVDVSRSGNSIQLSWPSTVGKTYQVQYKNDPASAWVPLPPNIVAVSATTSFTESIDPGRQRYYRAVELP
jgi:hypothetical protein